MYWTTPTQRTLVTLLVVSLLVAGLLLGVRCSLASELTTSESLKRPSNNFAIADFDGDQKPDFATVKQDRTGNQTVTYAIYFQLSRGSQPAMGITARSGGLQLFWRDVNGDDTLDLVVRSTMDSSLVAVLLNDGQGNFTRASPKQFAGLEKEPEFYFGSELGPFADGVSMLPLRTSFGVQGGEASRVLLQNNFEVLDRKEPQFSCGFLCESGAGRAPPVLR